MLKWILASNSHFNTIYDLTFPPSIAGGSLLCLNLYLKCGAIKAPGMQWKYTCRFQMKAHKSTISSYGHRKRT